MQWLVRKVPPPLVTAIFGVAMWFLSRYPPNIDLSPLLQIGVPLVLAVVALLFMFLARYKLHAAHTTVNPFRPHQTSALVTSGVFRLSRNPIYLAFLLLLIGWALFLANLWALLLSPLFVRYMSRFQIKKEEGALESLFGQRYLDYKKRVRCWL